MKDPIASGKAVTTNERPGAKCHSTRRRGEGPASLIEVRVRGGQSAILGGRAKSGQGRQFNLVVKELNYITPDPEEESTSLSIEE